MSWPISVTSRTPAAARFSASRTTDSNRRLRNLSAQLRNDAERAGMIAAFGDLDVRGMLRRRENARREIVIQIRRQAAALAAPARNSPSDGRQNSFDFACSDDRVHFRNLLANLVAVALDQASGDDQFFRAAEFLVLGHLQDRVDRFFLRGRDEAAGVDDQDVGFVGARREFVAVARENAHHHLAIDEVLRASQADKSDFRHTSVRFLPWRGNVHLNTVPGAAAVV